MNNIKNLLVNVVTHKPFDDSILPKGYHVVKVGKTDIDTTAYNWSTDCTGDNIAEENPYYCELTAQYWAWKNLPESIKFTGIIHYRRYFFDYNKSMWGGNSYTEDILKEERIRKILQRYKIIIPFISVKESGNSRLYRNIPINKQDKHWIIIYDIIKEFFPEEKESFETVIYGDYMVYGNMFISSRKIFNDYSKWLFSVLKKYDEIIASKGEDRIPRVDGFLSELLLLVWVKSHISENDIYYMEVRNVETDKFLDYKKGDIRYIIRFIRMHRRILIAYKNLKNKVKLIKIRH